MGEALILIGQLKFTQKTKDFQNKTKRQPLTIRIGGVVSLFDVFPF
jgi:hypothetical protein